MDHKTHSEFRWFKTSELGVDPSAPKDGDLVWIYYDHAKRLSGWCGKLEKLETDPELLKALDEKFPRDFSSRTEWRVREQAQKYYLRPGDRVCRVIIPEVPTL